MPEENNPTSPTADIVRLVVEDAAKDLRRARDALDKKRVEVNEEFQPALVALNDAQASLRAHERYKDHMSRQAWDEEQQRLQAAFDAAQRQVEQEKTRLLETLQAAQRRVQDLEQEWRVHERTARVAGIDADAILSMDWDLDAEDMEGE